jgi:hypothetical protein
MAFVNERIALEDIKKYDLEEIDKRYVVGGTNSRQWTIDKERNIYLRHVANGPREPELFGQGKWTLFLGGKLIELRIDIVQTTGGVNQACWTHYRLRYALLPQDFHLAKDEVILCLQEALLEYKDGGVFSSSTSFSLTLDV